MDEVTVRLIESGATIDKYIGDAVMAFWNAPEKQEDHLARALYASCLIEQDANVIREKIYALDEKLKEIKIAFGIGVASGVVTVGNMGSSFRFNYTVMGDTVNTAARLESLTKEKGVPILLTGANTNTYYAFNDRKIVLRPMGLTDVRGKKEAVNIYTAKFDN